MDGKNTNKKSLPAVHYYDDGVDFHLADGRIIRAREDEGFNLQRQKCKGLCIDLVPPEKTELKDVMINLNDKSTGRDAASVALTKDSAMALYLMLAHMEAEGFLDGCEMPIPLTHDNRTEKNN